MALLDFSHSPHGGSHRLLPESATQPRIAPRTLVFHSIVGSAAGAYNFFRTGSGLESTLIVRADGEIWQLVDTERRADANYKANSFAISVETEDGGDPDTQPWTPEQLDALTWIAHEVHRLHGIPLVAAPRWDGSGIGYHSQFRQWSPVVKSCPGRVRIRQFHDVLLPRIVGGPEEDDMPDERFFQFWFERFERIFKDQTGAMYNAANKHHGEAMEVRWRGVNLAAADGELLARIQDTLSQHTQLMSNHGELLERMAELAGQVAPNAGATQVLDKVDGQ